jgi:hypothetical protein
MRPSQTLSFDAGGPSSPDGTSSSRRSSRETRGSAASWSGAAANAKAAPHESHAVHARICPWTLARSMAAILLSLQYIIGSGRLRR